MKRPRSRRAPGPFTLTQAVSVVRKRHDVALDALDLVGAQGRLAEGHPGSTHAPIGAFGHRVLHARQEVALNRVGLLDVEVLLALADRVLDGLVDESPEGLRGLEIGLEHAAGHVTAGFAALRGDELLLDLADGFGHRAVRNGRRRARHAGLITARAAHGATGSGATGSR